MVLHFWEQSQEQRSQLEQSLPTATLAQHRHTRSCQDGLRRSLLVLLGRAQRQPRLLAARYSQGLVQPQALLESLAAAEEVVPATSQLRHSRHPSLALALGDTVLVVAAALHSHASRQHQRWL
jgi:hypothetical protein